MKNESETAQSQSEKPSNQQIQPDIEIYLKNVNFQTIQHWLSEVFSRVTLPEPSGKPVKLNVKHSHDIPVLITPNAAGKAFTSVWFQSDQTPWKTDEECANSFLSFCDAEVRCSANSWQEEEDEESDQWFSITRNEKRLIRWG